MLCITAPPPFIRFMVHSAGSRMTRLNFVLGMAYIGPSLIGGLWRQSPSFRRIG